MEPETSFTAYAKRPDGRDLVKRLEELQSRFDQIQRIAAEGQSILASLQPRLEEYSSWMAELETLVNRWQDPTERGRRAA